MTPTSLGGEEQISISGKRMIGKADESLWRKATGPVKWQPVAWDDMHCLWDSAFLRFETMESGLWKSIVLINNRRRKIKLWN